MTNRRRRYVRDEAPPPVVLTPRDEAGLVTLFEYRLLTSEQLGQVLGWPHVSHRNERLRKWFDRQLVDRVRGLTLGGGLQPVYRVGEAAVPLLVRYTAWDEARIRTRMQDDRRLATGLSLQHELEANQVRIALTGAVATRSDLHVESWLNTHDCYDRFKPGRAVRPDGFFRIKQRDTVAAFFHEHDRGTTSLDRWRAKVGRYLEYRDGGYYANRYSLQRFRVLTTAPSIGRLRELLAATREVTQRSFLFALTADVLSNAAPELPVWHAVGGAIRSLISTKGEDHALVLR